MLKTVFYINMPAVILLSITDLPLTSELFFLPLSAIIVHVILGISSYVIANSLDLDLDQVGVVIVGSLIMSTSFIVPFVLVFQDEIGLGLLLLFDLGNTIMSLSIAYFFAVYYGKDDKLELSIIRQEFLKKFITAPPVIALFVALFLNANEIELPPVILPALDILKFLFTPLIMIALGMFFIPRISQIQPVLSTLLLRTLGGLIIGWICVLIFGLTGLERLIVLIGSAAPVGFVTVAFASLEDLDVELAANIVSLSAVCGLLFVPVFFLIL